MPRSLKWEAKAVIAGPILIEVTSRKAVQIALGADASRSRPDGTYTGGAYVRLMKHEVWELIEDLKEAYESLEE